MYHGIVSEGSHLNTIPVIHILLYLIYIYIVKGYVVSVCIEVYRECSAAVDSARCWRGHKCSY